MDTASIPSHLLLISPFPPLLQSGFHSTSNHSSPPSISSSSFSLWWIRHLLLLSLPLLLLSMSSFCYPISSLVLSSDILSSSISFFLTGIIRIWSISHLLTLNTCIDEPSLVAILKMIERWYPGERTKRREGKGVHWRPDWDGRGEQTLTHYHISTSPLGWSHSLFSISNLLFISVMN